MMIILSILTFVTPGVSEPTKLAVLGFRATGLQTDVADNLTELFTTEVGNTESGCGGSESR